jgi:chromate transporter
MKKYLELFLVFFKLGAFTFGGGYTMVPLIRNEVVEKRRWIEEEEFMDMLSIALSAPGPIALNTALFVGNSRLGFKGSLFSAAGVILPSFLIILLVAIVLTQFKDNALVERVFKGIRPAVVALIAAPLFSLGKSAGVNLRNIWIPAVATFAVWWLGVSPIYIVLTAILLGIFHLMWLKRIFRK